MFISSEIILPFAANFVDDLNEALKKIGSVVNRRPGIMGSIYEH